MKSMKGLFVIRTELRWDQAPPTRVWYLANEISKSGLPTIIVGMESEKDPMLRRCIHTVKLMFKGKIGNVISRIHISLVALKILLAENVGWVILRGYDMVPLAFFIKLFNRKLIYDFHGYRYREQIIEGRVLRSRSTKIFEWFMLRCADYIIVIKDEMREDMPLNLHKKILLLPNGVNLKEFSTIELSGSILDQYGIPANKKIVGFVGNWEAWVDIEEVLNSAKYLDNDTVLLIIGEGKNLDRYKMEYPSVILTGRIPHDDVIYLLNKIDVCVYPYSNEPIIKSKSSRKTLEYLASGKPIVISDVDGRDLFLKEGENVLLYKYGFPQDLAEKVKILFKDKKLCEKLSESNLELAQFFSWSAVMKRSHLIDILK